MNKFLSTLFVVVLISSIGALLSIKLIEWACEDTKEWWYNAGRQATLIRLTLPVLVIERIYNDLSRL